MRRWMLKWLHWPMAPLIVWFRVVEPDHVADAAPAAAKTAALATHAGVGLLMALMVMIWVLGYWRDGPAGRPGPKLSSRARRIHTITHHALYWAMPAALLSGALAGLAAPFPVEAFGAIPLNFGGWVGTAIGVGAVSVHDIAMEIHEIAFNLLTLIAIAHIAFHLWRHYLLRDGALRIMAPRMLHRWL